MPPSHETSELVQFLPLSNPFSLGRTVVPVDESFINEEKNSKHPHELLMQQIHYILVESFCYVCAYQSWDGQLDVLVTFDSESEKIYK